MVSWGTRRTDGRAVREFRHAADAQGHPARQFILRLHVDRQQLLPFRVVSLDLLRGGFELVSEPNHGARDRVRIRLDRQADLIADGQKCAGVLREVEDDLQRAFFQQAQRWLAGLAILGDAA